MRSPWRDRPERAWWRAVLTIAATFVAFLLFAQFGFLSQLQRDLHDAALIRLAMAAMGLAGLVASLAAAWLLGRVSGVRLIRMGLGGVALVAVASTACHGFASLVGVAAAIGASLGLLTVAVASSLPEIMPSGLAGRAAGLGTGAAYLLSNVPMLFEADPAVRAMFSAALACAALLFPPRSLIRDRQEGQRSLGILRLLLIFLVLVWLDSAAFAIVQANPALKAQTWGSPAQKLLQGSVHFVAAAGAGALLDMGFGLAVPLAAWILFAVAFPLLQHGGPGAVVAGPLYAAGISLYSTALIVLPSRRAGNPRWRAGLLYGIAGWLGSALGVGMAQDLGNIPGWFLVVTGIALVAAGAPLPVGGSAMGEGSGVRSFVPTLFLGAGLSLPLLFDPPTAATAAARGRRVYIEEGCIHCHSQYVRAGMRDEAWWGPAKRLDRGERPPLVGVRRQGPDLLQVGNRRGELWHELHLRDPRALNPRSRMPSYDHLFDGDGTRGRDLVAYLSSLGASTAVERWEQTGKQAIAPSSTPSAARGAVLFAESCAACHGAEGRGEGLLAARLNDPYVTLRKPVFHSVRPGAEPIEQTLARIIRFGLPPTSMPGHEWLTDQQVADLVAFVKTLPEEIR